MKQTTVSLLLVLTVFGGCSESTKTKKSSSSSTNQLPSGCYYDYANNVVCPSGSTTGTTTGGTTTGTTTGTSGGGSGTQYVKTPSDNSWTALYDNASVTNDNQANGQPKPSVPTESCTPIPSGSGYNTRKGTITMAFERDSTRDDYSPVLSGLSGFDNNVSYFLTSADDAAAFVSTDYLLKARFMPRPQPKPTANSVYCYGRKTGSGSGTAYGYSKLSYAVSLRPVLANGTLGPRMGTQYLTTGINRCSPAIDFSGYAQNPSYDRWVIVVHDVYSDQSCSYSPCGGWSQTTTTCWQMDIEVAVDGTKTF